MADARKAIDRADFSGGVNSSASPHAVGRTQVLRADNMVLAEQGALQVRDGVTTGTTLPAGIVNILEVMAYFPNPLLSITLAIARYNDGTQKLLRTTASVWSVLGTFVAPFDTPTLTKWLGKVLATDGYQVPVVTDGTTFAPITGTPLATPGAPTVTPVGGSATTYSYQIVAFNDNGTTPHGPTGTTGAGPAVLSSSQYNIINWTVVPNALGYYVYRTAGGVTLGKIATVGTITVLLDVGLTGDNTGAPTVDTTVSVIPGAQSLLVHAGALWAWNTAAATSDFDGPSSLRQSDFNRLDNWPISFQTFIAKDDGEAGMGLAAFTVADTGISPDAFLVAFKEFSTYLVAGTFGPQGAAPTITQVKTDLGCIAPKSIQFVTAEGISGIIRLSHQGFALYDGLNDHRISEPVRAYLFGRDDIVGLDWAAAQSSVGSQSHDPPLYVCACPVLGTAGNTRVFLFDLVRRAWTICTFPVPFGSLNSLIGPFQSPLLVAGEAGTGRRIFQMFQGLTTDDGVAIPWRVRFPPVVPPGHLVYAQRMLAALYHIAAGQTVTGQFALGPGASGVTATKTQRVRVGAGAVVGSPFAAVLEDTVSFEIGLVGDGLYAELSGTGSLGIRGVSYQVTAKPVTRPFRV